MINYTYLLGIVRSIKMSDILLNLILRHGKKWFDLSASEQFNLLEDEIYGEKKKR